MQKNKKNLFLIAFLLIIVALTGLGVGLRTGAQESELALEYPGLTILGCPAELETGIGLGCFVKYIFIFSLGTVGIIALLVLIWGGLRYIMSAGDPSAQRDAQQWIQGAILGILLLLGSWLILNTINPDLVSFDPSFSAPEIPPFEFSGPTEVNIGQIEELKICMQNAEAAENDKEFVSCAGSLGWSLICDGVQEIDSCAWLCWKGAYNYNCAGLAPCGDLVCEDFCPEFYTSDLPQKQVSDKCFGCLFKQEILENPMVDITSDFNDDDCKKKYGVGCAHPLGDCPDPHAYNNCVTKSKEVTLENVDACKCGPGAGDAPWLSICGDCGTGYPKPGEAGWPAAKCITSKM